MSRNHHEAAEEYASSAETALLNAGDTNESPSLLLQKATADALMAVYHQLKAMEDDTITLRGAADLADALAAHNGTMTELAAEMDHLARRMPDH